jgi:cytochrome oxidase Cu insertion factor (SCO1/SenC/PrrC family)
VGLARRPVLAALLLSAALAGHASPARIPLWGTVYAARLPAADFTLTDQQGRSFRMADTRGKVVILSFLYTHCTDYCPFLALKLREMVRLLGRQAADVVVVPVTTDPRRDTPQVLAEYSRALGMYDSWHFVTGPVSSMTTVWKDYFIGVEKPLAMPAASLPAAHGSPPVQPKARFEAGRAARGLGRRDREDGVGMLVQRFGGGYEVAHDTPFWIVDKAGLLRASLDADAAPSEIVFDIRALLAETPQGSVSSRVP